MLKPSLILLLFFSLFRLDAYEEDIIDVTGPTLSKEPIERYTPNPYVNSAIWYAIAPYLLPENHPIKAKLDKLFKSSRITLNSQTLKQAGFESTTPRSYSNCIVTTHPKFKGYIFKLYTDDQPFQMEWIIMLKRIAGAMATQACIERHGFQDTLVVPKKWLYPIPAEPSPPLNYFRKNYILIAEDMEIVSRKKNFLFWKERMTPELMNMLFIVFQEVGLFDSVHISNVPFTYDRKLAFIDTEHHSEWPVNFEKLMPYLSEEMQTYLRSLMTGIR